MQVKRKGVTVTAARKEYVLKPPPAAGSRRRPQKVAATTGRGACRVAFSLFERFRVRAAPVALGRDRSATARAVRRPRQVGLVDIRPHEIDAEPRARHGGAAQAAERIHGRRDARQAVKPEALLGQARRKRGRMRAIAIAPLNRLVRDEPGVAAAPDAVGGAAPAGDVRLILVRHAERQPIEAGRPCGVK